MIIEKLKQQENFTETEKSIANYILNPNNSIVGMTSSQLGKVTFTSQSAVVRLYKKLGIESYRLFYTLILEDTNTLDLNEENEDGGLKKDMTIDDIIDVVGRSYINEIKYLKILINKHTIQRIYNRLKSSNIVNIYAIGNDVIIAKEFIKKLEQFNIYFHIIESYSEFKIRSQYKKADISIMISLDDNNTLISIAEELLKEDSYIFGLIGNQHNKLKRYCQDCIFIDFENISKLIGAFLIIDMIYSTFVSNSKIGSR